MKCNNAKKLDYKTHEPTRNFFITFQVETEETSFDTMLAISVMIGIRFASSFIGKYACSFSKDGTKYVCNDSGIGNQIIVMKRTYMPHSICVQSLNFFMTYLNNMYDFGERFLLHLYFVAK